MAKKHHTLGGSTTSRWMNCPGSVAAITLARKAGLIPKKDKGSIFAQEGTRAHNLGEHCLRKGFEPLDFYGNKFESAIMTDSYVDAVETYVNYCRSKVKAYKKKYGKENVDVFIERKFDMTKLFGYDSGGSGDYVIAVRNGPLDVIDYKHGQGIVVEAKGNTQCRFYGFGMWKKLNKKYKFTRSNNTIIQPRARHQDGPIRTEKLSKRELMKWGNEELLPAVEAVKDPDAPLVAGDKQCQWCPIASICKENAKRQLAITKNDFKDIINEEDGGVKYPDVNTLSVYEMERIIKQKKPLEHWLKLVYEHLSSIAQLGTPLEENKLVATYGHRKIEDQKKAIKLLKKAGMKEKDLYADRVFKSASKIETFLKHELKLEKEKINRVMGKIVTKPENGITLASVDDKREALPPPAKSDFAKVKKTKKQKLKTKGKRKNGKIKQKK